MVFDLNLFSFCYKDGMKCESFEDWFASAAPKRAARGRQEDLLIMLLTLNGKEKFFDNNQKDFLQNLSDEFFKSSGSVTTAIRMVIDRVNFSLLEKNLKLRDGEQHQSAFLELCVIHHDTLIIAQCGPGHTVLLNNKGVNHFHDSEISQNGLGLSRITDVRYFQSEISESDIFLITNNIPSNLQLDLWNKEDQWSFNDLTKVLSEKHDDTQNVGLIQILPGEGQVVYKSLITMEEKEVSESGNNLVKETIIDDRMERQSEIDVQPLKIDTGPLMDSKNEQNEVTQPEGEKLQKGHSEFEDLSIAQLSSSFNEEKDLNQNKEPVTGSTDKSIRISSKTKNSEVPEEEDTKSGNKIKRFSFNKSKIFTFFSVLFGWLNKLTRKISTFFSAMSHKIIKTTSPENPEVSKGTLLMVAIIVPVLIVTLAASIYLSRGKSSQYEMYYELGMAAEQNADRLTDPVAKQNAWNDALKNANLALSYQDTREAQELKGRAQYQLDNLEGAERLTFAKVNLIGNYSKIDIRKIIEFGSDLFLMDKSGGEILYFYKDGDNYTLSDEFFCSPGSYNGLNVGPLIDVIGIPINNKYKASLLAIDAEGNLLYCSIGTSAQAIPLIVPPNGWDKIKSITYDMGKLYVLDAGGNEIWIYQGNSLEFLDEPIPYFAETDRNISAAIDFEKIDSQMFILYNDGHMAKCNSSVMQGINLQCEDRLEYKDVRSTTNILDLGNTPFKLLQYSDRIGPSLFMTTVDDSSLYQFSVDLKLNFIFRTKPNSGNFPFSAPTALTLTDTRKVWIAFGDQLYNTMMP